LQCERSTASCVVCPGGGDSCSVNAAWHRVWSVQVETADGPVRKRRRLSALIETPKVPPQPPVDAVEHLTYAGDQSRQRCQPDLSFQQPCQSSRQPCPCQSDPCQSTDEPVACSSGHEQSAAAPPHLSASLHPPAVPSRASTRSSQHVLHARHRYDIISYYYNIITYYVTVIRRVSV